MTVSSLGLVRARLRSAFAWRDGDSDQYADLTGWWRDADLLALLGPALAQLFADATPTVILGPDSRGSLIGPLVAVHLGLGFVEVRKNRTPASDSDQWIRRTTAPDYHDRHIEFGFRRNLVRSSDQVLAVDDWIATGSQARAAQAMIDDIGATWVGFGCIVDALDDSRIRRDLGLRSLLHLRDL